jgi:oligopeptide/dipeptide ABC transporter ATP-binding protein
MHPYTEGLLHCVPKLGEKFVPIKGMPPSLINRPPTCPFLPRCRMRKPSCFTDPVAELTHVEDQHFAACNVRLEESRHDSNN